MIEVVVFGSKALIIVLSLICIILLIAFIVAKSKHAPELEIIHLNEKYKDIEMLMKLHTLDKEEIKAEKKRLKAEDKAKEKEKKQKAKAEKSAESAASTEKKSRVFLIRFKGDVKASQTETLTQEINAILQVGTPNDEVIAIIESPGGVVHGYGHAAAQLVRVRTQGLKLTACVDEVAASGGYLMSCVAHQILAAPFAIVGSIGVVAQVPNFNRVLKKYDVDYKEYTAGDFKRTVSVFGEITPKGEQKFIDQLEDTHGLFKKFVHQFRPQLDLQKVATGEYWYGDSAIHLGLLDKIQTSDDYVLEKIKEKKDVIEIKYEKKKNISEKISEILGNAAERSISKLVERLEKETFV